MAKILLKRKTGTPVLSGENADKLQEGEVGIIGSKLLYGPTSGGSNLVDPKQIAVTNDSNTFFGGNLTIQVANGKTFSFQNNASNLNQKYFVGEDGYLRTDITNSNLTGTMLVNANYVNNLLGEVDAMIFKGIIQANSGEIESEDPSVDGKFLKGSTNLLQNYSAGWTFKVGNSGTIPGLTPNSVLENGDMIIIIKNYDTSFSIADFHSLQGNVDGAVTGPSSSTDNAVALFNSTSGKIIKNSTLIFNGSNLNVPGSLTLGTQTNKATINYATNDSRTLTIPNLGGNRTFAFIDQAQTFSQTQIFSQGLVISRLGTTDHSLSIGFITNEQQNYPYIRGSGTILQRGTSTTQYTIWDSGTLTNLNQLTNGPGYVTSSGVTSVTGTSPVVSSGGTTPDISLAAGYGDTLNPYGSKTARHALIAPSSGGVPTFRALGYSDIGGTVPTWNQNTTGNADTASELETSRNLWGQSFDGSANVTGDMSSVGNIMALDSNAYTRDIFTDSGVANKIINLGTGRTAGITIINIAPSSGITRHVNIAGVLRATSMNNTNGHFYRETNNNLPTQTERLKYAGHFYATQFEGLIDGGTWT